jgi:hypothetical protein
VVCVSKLLFLFLLPLFEVGVGWEKGEGPHQQQLEGLDEVCVRCGGKPAARFGSLPCRTRATTLDIWTPQTDEKG